LDRFRSFVRFAFGVALVGILINLVSSVIDDRYPAFRNLLIGVAVAGVVGWLLVLLTQYVFSHVAGGRYAVEALILNSRNELLMYRHPHHKVMLPPGGRVKRSEFPNFALQLRLEERLGLNPRQYRFDDHFHHGIDENTGHLGEIQRFAAPFLVQREIHRQRTFVRFHYDLIYVLRLLDDHTAFDSPKYDPVHFVDLAALREMVAQRRSFPDVLDAYRRVLDTIHGAQA
jgi:hypothetical protein